MGKKENSICFLLGANSDVESGSRANYKSTKILKKSMRKFIGLERLTNLISI